MNKEKYLSRIGSALLAALVGCGGPAGSDTSSGDVNAEGEDEISALTPAYVTLERDRRRCVSPMCGGYWASDVNRTTPPRYVSDLDFSSSGLDDATVAIVRDAPTAEILVRGRLGALQAPYGTRPLLVLEAYRGLPGVLPGNGDPFYSVTSNDPPIQCFTAPCNNDHAQKLNRATTPVSFTGVSVASAAKGFVDQEWLVNRVERHGAVVAGALVRGQQFPGGRELVLEASQVYIHLPETVGPCPLMPIAQCPAGEMNAFDRNADRCEVPAGCVAPGMCPAFFPMCDEGYTLVSWTSAPSGCPAYACDPSFASEAPTSRCALVRCAAGYTCVEEGPDACVPVSTCAVVLCAPDTHCQDGNGAAQCLPNTWVSETVTVASAHPYSNNQRLSWTFTSDEPNALEVRIHFASFSLEAEYDFVVIQDLNGNELARFTGELGEFTTPSYQGSALRILFTSDSSVTRQGFAIDHIDSRTN